MKKHSFFLVFLIVTLAFSLLLIPSTKASPDTETLWVNSFDSSRTDWIAVGDSPYLNDNDANYIYEGWFGTDEEGDFGFADSGVGSGTINSVKLQLECKKDGAKQFKVFIWDGIGWTDKGAINPDLDVYSYKEVDVSAELDSWTKIDSAKIYVAEVSAGTNVNVYVRRAKLVIDYTTEGIQHIADLTQSISSTWNVVTQWNAIVDLSQELSTSWNVVIESTFNIASSLAITSSWLVDVIHTVGGGVQHIADLTQSLSTTWNVLTQWNALVDLSQSLSSTWNVLTEWDALTSLTQSFSTSWNVIVETSFNVASSLSITASWLVNVLKGLQHIADLTQTISTTWNIFVEYTYGQAPELIRGIGIVIAFFCIAIGVAFILAHKKEKRL